MWAFAVYNKKHDWVEVWYKMPYYDEETSSWIGDGYLGSMVIPEVPVEFVKQVRKHEPLMISVTMQFGFFASKSSVKLMMSHCPEVFNGQKVNNDKL